MKIKAAICTAVLCKCPNCGAGAVILELDSESIKESIEIICTGCTNRFTAEIDKEMKIL